jgi:hypothetical protein
MTTEVHVCIAVGRSEVVGFLIRKGETEDGCHDLKTPHCRILIPGAGKGCLFLLLSGDLRVCKLGVWRSLCRVRGSVLDIEEPW